MPFEKPEFQPRTIPKDEFFAKAEALTEEELMQLGLGKKEKKSSQGVGPLLEASFRNPESGQEQAIEINLEEKIVEFRKFYKDKFNLEINEAEIRNIWVNNHAEIKSEIEKYGYDSILIVPENLPGEAEVNRKAIETIDEGAGKGKVAATKYWAEQQSIVSVKENKYKIILTHSAQNLADQPLLKVTKGKNIMTLTGLNPDEVATRITGNQELSVNLEVDVNGQKIEIKAEGLSLEEYEIFQRTYFEKTGKHLDEIGWTWLLKSCSGSRVVLASWSPGVRQLNVSAYDPGNAAVDLGLRLSRSFSN